MSHETTTLSMRVRRIATHTVAFLVGGSMAAGLVTLSNQRATADLQQQHAAAIAMVEQETARLRDELTELKQTNRFLQSRVGLARSLDELDRRNFGRAQELVAKAGAELAGWCGDRSPCPLADQHAAMASFQLEVGTELEGQRQTLADLARQLDGSDAANR